MRSPFTPCSSCRIVKSFLAINKHHTHPRQLFFCCLCYAIVMESINFAFVCLVGHSNPMQLLNQVSLCFGKFRRWHIATSAFNVRSRIYKMKRRRKKTRFLYQIYQIVLNQIQITDIEILIRNFLSYLYMVFTVRTHATHKQIICT